MRESRREREKIRIKVTGKDNAREIKETEMEC